MLNQSSSIVHTLQWTEIHPLTSPLAAQCGLGLRQFPPEQDLDPFSRFCTIQPHVTQTHHATG